MTMHVFFICCQFAQVRISYFTLVFCGNRQVLFPYTDSKFVPYSTGRCFLYSDKLPCVFTNTNKDQLQWRIQQINHGRQGFMAINKPCPGAAPLAQVVYGPQIPVYHGLSINSPLFLW